MFACGDHGAKHHIHKSVHNCTLHVGGSRVWERLCMQTPFRPHHRSSPSATGNQMVWSLQECRCLLWMKMTWFVKMWPVNMCSFFTLGGKKPPLSCSLFFCTKDNKLDHFSLVRIVLFFLDESHSVTASSDMDISFKSGSYWKSGQRANIHSDAEKQYEPRITGCDCCDNDGLVARAFTFILQFRDNVSPLNNTFSSLPSSSVREPFF